MIFSATGAANRVLGWLCAKKFDDRHVKALLHKAIFPATCNATDDESIAKQVAEDMLHVATCLATLQKV